MARRLYRKLKVQTVQIALVEIQCVCLFVCVCVCLRACVCVCVQVEARSVDNLKRLNRGMENKIIELQQKLTEQVRDKNDTRQ